MTLPHIIVLAAVLLSVSATPLTLNGSIKTTNSLAVLFLKRHPDLYSKSIKVDSQSAEYVLSPTTIKKGSGGGKPGGKPGVKPGGRPTIGRPTKGGSGGSDDDEEACFPANANVTVDGRGIMKMADLAIGDRVRLINGQYSEVFVFSHKLEKGWFNFVKLITDDGAVTLSKGHYLYADGKLVAAGSVKKGANLEREDGQQKKVVKVENVIEWGLYNPHTIDGDLMVDGFRTSCYTTAVEPGVGNSLLAPLRAMYRTLGMDITTQWLHGGVSRKLRGQIFAGPNIIS